MQRRASLVESASMHKPYQFLIDPPLGEGLAAADGYVEARFLCARNQTRNCVLGKKIACGDFSFAWLAEQMPRLTPQSGSGLWLVPFKGIPADEEHVLLDLIYLDAECRVMAVVELFPTDRVSPSIPPAASVLALPIDTIYPSGTKVGDQLAFGLAEEFDPVEALPVEKAKPHSFAVPQAVEVAGATKPPQKPALAQPSAMQPAKAKSWWRRLFFPDPEDPRRAMRASLSGLSSYFWDGGAPRAHEIRDISSTGLYVVTDERWYPGTLIQMTLKKTFSEVAQNEAAITLMARANRWGNDGVGLSFVVRDPRKPRDGDNEGVERELLDRFLARIKQAK
jgi:hypothetical protein